jgi:hypothetical protein
MREFFKRIRPSLRDYLYLCCSLNDIHLKEQPRWLNIPLGSFLPFIYSTHSNQFSGVTVAFSFTSYAVRKVFGN